MVRNSPHNLAKRPLSTRKALLVWFGCALTGWLVAIFSIYGVLEFGDRVVAALSDSDDVRITEQEDRAVQDIAPAAGGAD